MGLIKLAILGGGAYMLGKHVARNENGENNGWSSCGSWKRDGNNWRNRNWGDRNQQQPQNGDTFANEKRDMPYYQNNKSNTNVNVSEKKDTPYRYEPNYQTEKREMAQQQQQPVDNSWTVPRDGFDWKRPPTPPQYSAENMRQIEQRQIEQQYRDIPDALKPYAIEYAQQRAASVRGD